MVFQVTNNCRNAGSHSNHRLWGRHRDDSSYFKGSPTQTPSYHHERIRNGRRLSCRLSRKVLLLINLKLLDNIHVCQTSEKIIFFKNCMFQIYGIFMYCIYNLYYNILAFWNINIAPNIWINQKCLNTYG